MAEEKQTFLDRLGPTLTSALIVAFLSATSLGAVSLRDLVITTNVDIAYLKSEQSKLHTELEQFKLPGERFTKGDGERHRLTLEDHERRIREQETRLPRLGPSLEKLEDKVEEIASKQAELCKRLQDCNVRNR